MAVRFAGYAAVFDAPDRGGDIVRAGAFSRVDAAGVPLLFEHGGAPVGRVEMLAEDTRGLRVIGQVADPRIAAWVADGTLRGLSFGYRACSVRRGVWRELLSVALFEVSLVAVPMQTLARVHAIAGEDAAGGPGIGDMCADGL